MKEISEMQSGELDRYRRYLENAFGEVESRRKFRLPDFSASFALLTLFALLAIGFSAYCMRPAQARMYQQQKSFAMEKK